jgi:regulator of sigma E protease
MYWGLFIYGVPGIKPILGNVSPGTPAAAAQLQEKQMIVSINGTATPSWQDVRWTILDTVLQGDKARLELSTPQAENIQRELDISSLTAADLDGDFMGKLGLQTYQPVLRPVIGKIVDGGAAQHAGLQQKDTILRANGEEISDWGKWVEVVRDHADTVLHVELNREGHLLQLDIKPETVTEAGKQIGRIGAAPLVDEHEFDAMLIDVHYAPLQALQQSVRKTWETSVVSLKMMGRMILGQVSLKNLSGPVTIADYAGQSAHMGLGAYISFLALISISLGVLNLLPIPLLDGGHLLYYTVEWIKGSPVPELFWDIGQKLGMSILFVMMALALFNDFSRLFFK